jgi:hypothetical protein
MNAIGLGRKKAARPNPTEPHRTEPNRTGLCSAMALLCYVYCRLCTVRITRDCRHRDYDFVVAVTAVT